MRAPAKDKGAGSEPATDYTRLAGIDKVTDLPAPFPVIVCLNPLAILDRGCALGYSHTEGNQSGTRRRAPVWVAFIGFGTHGRGHNDMGQVKVTWFGEKQFVGVDSSKHSVVLSAQDEANGTGMKPSDLLLVALAGCTAVDVVGILKKKRQDLRGLEINVSATQDSDPPWTFRKIELEFVVSGAGLREKAVADAVQIAEEKYCSVSATVREVAEVVTRYRIVEV